MPADRHRPRFHFTLNNWMNDIIPFIHNGETHIYFDYNPREARWTQHSSWGHARSRDLARWEELPVAFAPQKSGADAGGCWTGCIVEHEGKFWAFYTGISEASGGHQTQCLAWSDDLIHWTQYEGNPILAAPPAGFGECWRDPQVWKDGDTWQMIIGSEVVDGDGPAVLLYHSDDGLEWSYSHPLWVGEPDREEFDAECPDFFELDGQHVLLSSRNRQHWRTGQYLHNLFIEERKGICDASNDDSFYAAKSAVDENGRRLLWGWIREKRPDEANMQAGWASVISLPRVLSVLPDGILAQAPAPELEILRGEKQQWHNLEIAPQSTFVLPDVQSDAYELRLRVAVQDTHEFGVRLRCTEQGNDGIDIVYDAQSKYFGAVPLQLQQNQLELRIWVDASVIEAFANNQTVQTKRFYPESEDSLHLAFWTRGGTATIQALEFWPLQA
jgi:beta-fructofuranosidase